MLWPREVARWSWPSQTRPAAPACRPPWPQSGAWCSSPAHTGSGRKICRRTNRGAFKCTDFQGSNQRVRHSLSWVPVAFSCVTNSFFRALSVRNTVLKVQFEEHLHGASQELWVEGDDYGSKPDDHKHLCELRTPVVFTVRWAPLQHSGTRRVTLTHLYMPGRALYRLYEETARDLTRLC